MSPLGEERQLPKSKDIVLESSKRDIEGIDTKTPAVLTRLLSRTDIEIDRQLGIIRESMDPDYRFKYESPPAESGLNQIIDTEQRLAARASEMEFRRTTFWKSCCDSVIDRRATVFFTQVGIGAFVIIFAMAKLWMSQPYRCNGDDPSVFIGLISVILGWFVPAPSLK